MAVKFTKPEINVREKLAELDKPSGIAGEAMLRAETPQEQFDLIGAGRRNLIINGAMMVNQRGNKTGITAPGETFGLDRWYYDGWNSAIISMTQSTDAPDGFYNSLKVEVTTADAAYGSSTDYARVSQDVEGYVARPIGFGRSGAKPISISFWCKSSIAGEYACTIYTEANVYHYSGQYYIESPNTWEYKTITIPPHTLGTLGNQTNGANFRLQFHLNRAGPSYTVSPNIWTTAVDITSPTAQDQFIRTVNSTFYVTGVQLEAGKVATPFEHRSYGEELALCQRYFTVMPNGIFGVASSIASVVYSYHLPTQMRATPSVSLTSTNQRQGDTVAQGISLTSASISISAYANSSVAAFSISGTPSANFTAYRTYLYEGTGSFPAQVHLSAEL